MKRSMTLLGRLKDGGAKAVSNVGVVPKDLNFEFIKNLIEISGNEEDDTRRDLDRKRKEQLKKLKTKKSAHHLLK